MKKVLLYSMLFTGTILFGCSQNNQQANSSNTLNSNNQVNITADQAKEIALNETGGGQVIEFSSDMNDIVPNYEITILNDKTEYEFEISAVDGSILNKDQELMDETSNSPISNNQLNITEDEAKEIALNEVSGGTISEFRLEYDNGMPIYEITIYEGTTEYDFEISGVDGKIISHSVDNRFD